MHSPKCPRLVLRKCFYIVDSLLMRERLDRETSRLPRLSTISRKPFPPESWPIIMVTHCDQREVLRNARPLLCCFARITNSCFENSLSSCEDTVLLCAMAWLSLFIYCIKKRIIQAALFQVNGSAVIGNAYSSRLWITVTSWICAARAFILRRYTGLEIL